MGLTPESATAVPRLQRLNKTSIRESLRWLGRIGRGFLHTARRPFATLLLLGHASLARAEEPSRSGDLATVGQAADVSWSRRLALSHFERALELERRADIAQALREYSESIAIDSTYGDAYLKLGGLRERMGDPREAELIYSQAVRLADSRPRALLKLSRLHRAQGQSAKALSDLEAAVDLEATSEALQELAQNYVEARAWAAALATFRRIERDARESGDTTALESAKIEVRALRVLAAETDAATQPVARHDWVGRALNHIAER